MDVNSLVNEMINIVSDLDGMKKGRERTALLSELADKRSDLRDWKSSGGFAPDIGWPAALAL